MATILIPNTPDVAHTQQKTRLEGRDYVLRFDYNEREDRWYLSIFDDEQNPVLLGIKLVTNFPLLRHYRWNTEVPPGELMVVCLTGDQNPPGFAELGEGRRCELTYWEAATVAQLTPGS